MKTNYKAIGMQIKFLRESKNKTMHEIEDFMGSDHIGKIPDYENGIGIDNKSTLIRIADFFNPAPSFYHSLLSYGDFIKSPNILSLHLQHKLKKERININHIKKFYNVPQSTFNNWISGRSIPEGDSIYLLASIMESNLQHAEFLVKQSQKKS